MVSANTKAVITQAKAIYETLRPQLEPWHEGQFVAIEPMSRDYFVADTFDAAVREVRTTYPDRITHTIRIGHRTAFHIGLMEQ